LREPSGLDLPIAVFREPPPSNPDVKPYSGFLKVCPNLPSYEAV